MVTTVSSHWVGNGGDLLSGTFVPLIKGTRAAVDLLQSPMAVLLIQTGGAMGQAFQLNMMDRIQRKRLCLSYPLPPWFFSCPNPAPECSTPAQNPHSTIWQNTLLLVHPWHQPYRTKLSSSTPYSPSAVNSVLVLGKNRIVPEDSIFLLFLSPNWGP